MKQNTTNLKQEGKEPKSDQLDFHLVNIWVIENGYFLIPQEKYFALLTWIAETCNARNPGSPS